MPDSNRSGARTRRRVASRAGATVNRTVARADGVRAIEHELESWLERAVPDPSAPLDAEAVVRLVGDCLTSLGLFEAAASFTVNTVHFYRRKEILDPPGGRTSAARYDVRHLWQAIAARLAGQLALLTLAEAREAMGGRSERVLLAFVAERVLDARARLAARRSPQVVIGARPLAPTTVAERGGRQTGAAPPGGPTNVVPAVVVPLPGDAWCVVPASHPARSSPSAARALAQALVESIKLPPDTTLDS